MTPPRGSDRRARPSLRLERSLLATGAAVVVGLDEVGRGALAGPVAVGAVAVTAATGRPPVGVRDSKLLTVRARTALAPAIRRWAASHAVGWAGADEIDAFGLVPALRLAAQRALVGLRLPVVDVLLLDGTHDFLGPGAHHSGGAQVRVAEVRTAAGADNRMTTVAAASVIAKCARDALMDDLGAQCDDRYGWRSNKGYAAAVHRDALVRWGPTQYHRLTWG